MELVLEIVDAFDPQLIGQTRCFHSAGGWIGRSEECEWVLPDPRRHLSGRHALISCSGQQFHLIDESTNGTYTEAASEPIGRGQSVTLKDGDIILMAEYRIRATLKVRPQEAHHAASAYVPGIARFGRPQPLHPWMVPAPQTPSPGPGYDVQASAPVLDEAFDPPSLLPEDWNVPLEERVRAESSSPRPVPLAQTPVQEPVPPPTVPVSEQLDGPLQAFWSELGWDMPKGEQALRDAMALLGRSLRAALEGIVASEHARAQLKNSFRLERTLIQVEGNNPLKFTVDVEDVLLQALQVRNARQLPLDRAVAASLNDLKVHQSALLGAVRDIVPALLELVAPERIAQLAADGSQPFWRRSNVAASCWAAYEARYEELLSSPDFFQDALAPRFAKAYDVHVMRQKSEYKEEGA